MFSKIAAWAAGPLPEAINGAFSHGPVGQLDELHALPDGHLVVGLDRHGSALTQGLVEGGHVTWEGTEDPVHGLRRAIADAVSEMADLGQVEAFGGWEMSGDDWTRPIYVATGDPAADTEKHILRLVFAPSSDAVVEASFRGEDIPETAPECPAPAGSDLPDLN